MTDPVLVVRKFRFIPMVDRPMAAGSSGELFEVPSRRHRLSQIEHCKFTKGK